MRGVVCAFLAARKVLFQSKLIISFYRGNVNAAEIGHDFLPGMV